MDRFSFLVVVCAVFGVLAHISAAQTVHVVGDGMGWEIPTSPALSYVNWVSGRTFRVGDILEFNFVSNQHDVVRVPEASYTACSDDNAIGDIINTGPVNITLDSIGNHYYICTLGNHCNNGQRLAITVSSSSSTPAPAGPIPNPPPATPSPASTQPDACAPTTPHAGGPGASMVPPPSPANSASTSLVAGFLLITLSAAIAFLS